MAPGVYRGRYEEIATYTGLDGTTGTAFTIVAGGFALTAGGIDTQTVLTPDENRTDYAISVGTRVTEKDVTFAAATNQNLEPIQVNLNVIGSNPTGVSTVNVSFMRVTHDTTAMSNLRLKTADWYTVVGVAVKDVYIMQGEIQYTAGVTSSGEVAVLGLVLDAGASSQTCSFWRGVNITIRGAGTPANASGLFVRVESGATLTEGIRLMAEGTMTTGIRYGNISGGECPSHIYSVPAAGTGVTSGTADASGDVEGSIAIQVGNTTKYIHFWPNVAS